MVALARFILLHVRDKPPAAKRCLR